MDGGTKKWHKSKGSGASRSYKQVKSWPVSSLPEIAADSSDASNSFDKKAQRAQRFGSKPEQEFGLLSRGEDDRSKGSRAVFSENTTRGGWVVRVISRVSVLIQMLNYIQSHDVNSSEYIMSISPDREKLDKRLKTVQQNEGKNVKTGNNSSDAIVMSLRILREAVLSFPPDLHTKSIFLYSARASALLGYSKSYMPSILHLLQIIHPVYSLTKEELFEVVAIYVLHLVQLNTDLQESIQVLSKYVDENNALNSTIQAWLVKDYVGWTRALIKESNPAIRKVMTLGHNKMALWGLQEIEKAYFTMDLSYLETVIGMEWKAIIGLGCKWKVEGGVVIVRARGKKMAG